MKNQFQTSSELYAIQELTGHDVWTFECIQNIYELVLPFKKALFSLSDLLQNLRILGEHWNLAWVIAPQRQLESLSIHQLLLLYEGLLSRAYFSVAKKQLISKIIGLSNRSQAAFMGIFQRAQLIHAAVSGGASFHCLDYQIKSLRQQLQTQIESNEQLTFEFGNHKLMCQQTVKQKQNEINYLKIQFSNLQSKYEVSTIAIKQKNCQITTLQNDLLLRDNEILILKAQLQNLQKQKSQLKHDLKSIQQLIVAADLKLDMSQSINSSSNLQIQLLLSCLMSLVPSLKISN